MFNLRPFAAVVSLFFLTVYPAPQTGTITAVQVNSILDTLASNNTTN